MTNDEFSSRASILEEPLQGALWLGGGAFAEPFDGLLGVVIGVYPDKRTNLFCGWTSPGEKAADEIVKRGDSFVAIEGGVKKMAILGGGGALGWRFKSACDSFAEALDLRSGAPVDASAAKHFHSPAPGEPSGMLFPLGSDRIRPCQPVTGI